MISRLCPVVFSGALALVLPTAAPASPSLSGCYVVQPQKLGVGGPEGGRHLLRVQPLRPGEFEMAVSGPGGRQSFPVRSARPGELAMVGAPSSRPITEGLVMDAPPAADGEAAPAAPPQPVMLRVFAEKGKPVLLLVLPVMGYAERVSCPPRG